MAAFVQISVGTTQLIIDLDRLHYIQPPQDTGDKHAIISVSPDTRYQVTADTYLAVIQPYVAANWASSKSKSS